MSRDEQRPPIRSLRQHLSHLTDEQASAVAKGKPSAMSIAGAREDSLAELHAEARDFEPERWDGLS